MSDMPLPKDAKRRRLYLAGKVLEVGATLWLNPRLFEVVKAGTFAEQKVTLGEMLIKKDPP